MNEKIKFLMSYFYHKNVSCKTILIFIREVMIIDDLKNGEQRKHSFKIGKNVMNSITIHYHE